MRRMETIGANSLIVCAAAVLLATLISHQLEARYLPTRADNSQSEALKEIIKNVSYLFQQQPTITIMPN